MGFPKGVLSSPKPIKPGQHLSPKTEFKKGLIPNNKLPVGALTKRIHDGDYPRYWRKIAEPNIWIPNATFVWIEHGGNIPKGFIIHHIDKDTLNDSMKNLSLLGRGAHRNIHQEDLMKGKINFRYRTKIVLCPDCKREITAKKNGSLCKTCRDNRRRHANRAYKQRLRDRIRSEQSTDNP